MEGNSQFLCNMDMSEAGRIRNNGIGDKGAIFLAGRHIDSSF
jgi:hypothetical protein